MKILILILSLINGVYMLADGLHVMFKGKYIGPEIPGPWAILFNRLNINVFKLGPVFILYGLLWIAWCYLLYNSQSWSYAYGLILAILTLWYLPAGTIISLIIIGILLFGRHRVGF